MWFRGRHAKGIRSPGAIGGSPGTGHTEVLGMTDHHGSLMGLYIGIFLVTLSGPMFEIALTRIFSATIWYHFAFVAISVALLGWGLGGFALHLARAGASVTGVDSSLPALEAAERNQKRNAPAIGEIEWIEANAFDLLKDYAAARRLYDTIVLDPPAFAKSKKALSTAMRGYKELNLRALKMLRPGGVLVTCSCSFHVGESDFLEMLRAAAFDARKSPRLIERRGQAKDHPVLLSVPETAYLKCVVLTV